MLRQLISKWGIMSIEMRDAFSNDDSIIYQDGAADYIGNDDIPKIPEIINGADFDLQADPETGEVIEDNADNSDSAPDNKADSENVQQVTMGDL
jgi:recombination protein RecT